MWPGIGNGGYLGDGGPATAAPLNSPKGLAVDEAGNLYIADSDDNRIRRLGTDGTIQTVAGTGTAGFSGDGGPALAAQLSGPTALAVDAAGNLYILDAGNSRVRKLTSDGTIHTVAGGGPEVPGYGDGGTATSASLRPGGIAIDSAGNLYIADSGHYRVRKVSTTGIITTVAGGDPTFGQVLDGIPAVGARLVNPVSVAVDRDGNLFVGDLDIGSIRVVRPDGIIDSLFGVADASTNNASGMLPLFLAAAIATDSAGNLYVTENLGYQRVRRATVWRNTGGPPRILPQAIVSSAAMLVEPAAPGELVSLFGTDLGPANGVSNSPGSSGHYTTQLAGVQVLFNGIPAPVLYAQASQVNTVVPFGIAANSRVTVQVSYRGETSAAVSVATAAIAPEVFQATPPPRAGQAAALNQDGTMNSTSNPAALGSIVVLYATGAGAFQPPLQDGGIVTDITAKPVVPVSVVIAR